MMYQLPEGNYAAYLRKSRMDIEAEARGEEDTYARHERILFELARRYGVNFKRIYKEKPATSGERISERPEMLDLLADVENEDWTGVFVVEVERLARGDTMDQGIVAQTFKYSNTLIVTPMRIYDPSNPDDEEYFEFGLFMSRREFKTINRRLQSGRLVSVKDGKYAANRPPYGYQRVKLPGKGWTLEPHPEQAPIVKLIFEMYTHPDPKERRGTGLIARFLNNKKIPTARNREWTVATINGILRNPTYIGNVRWNSRPVVKKRTSKSRPRKPRDQWIEVKGVHPAIIDEPTFNRAQEIMQGNSHPPAPAGKISNPLAGLIRCDMCGGAMVYRPYTGNRQPPTLICITQSCKNVSSYFDLVEERLIEFLHGWLAAYKDQWSRGLPDDGSGREGAKLKAYEKMLDNLQKQLTETQAQLDNLHDLLERNVYTVEVFLERSEKLGKKLADTKLSIQQTEGELEMERKRSVAKKDTIPLVEHILKVYPHTEDPAEKNALLRAVIEEIRYRKEKGGRWNRDAMNQFELWVSPRISR